MDSQIRTEFELVVGLEVHIQLSTQSKLFASDPTSFDEEPNKNISVITLAHPGTMPRLNKKAVEYAIRMGLACNCEISRYSFFDRKNYFYPDLPKGFQTTQDNAPICIGGAVNVYLNDESIKKVELNRIHLEEDAGKSIHDDNSHNSLIDLNRAGVPLIELVTEPCIRSAEEAMAFLTEIRSMVRFLEICDGNMEQGSLRCDANISIRKRGDQDLGKKAEVKNMNSIRNVGRAIKHEFERQTRLLLMGEEIVSETRLFDANIGRTSGMRTKEELNDYRYFPEPDISPFTVSDQWLEKIKSCMPDTPGQLREKFQQDFGLSKYDAEVLTREKYIAVFFEEVCQCTSHYKQAANWIQGAIKSYLNENDDEVIPISASCLAEMIDAIVKGEINASVAKKKLLPFLMENQPKTYKEAVEDLGFIETGKDDNSVVILEVLNAFPDKVVAYQSGKKNLLGLFMGEVMKRTGGKADPQKARQLLIETLEKKN